MKIILEKEEFLQNTIRDAIAVNPLVSIRRMQEIVKQNTGHSISDKYTAKLMKKIRRRAVIQSDRKLMNERLSEVRERFRVITDDLFRTIYWRPDFLIDYGLVNPSPKERLAAMKLLGQLELALFKAEVDTGVFENRQIIVNRIPGRCISLAGEVEGQIIPPAVCKFGQYQKENLINGSF